MTDEYNLTNYYQRLMRAVCVRLDALIIEAKNAGFNTSVVTRMNSGDEPPFVSVRVTKAAPEWTELKETDNA